MNFIEKAKEANIKPEQLALMLHVSTSTARRWLIGECNPSPLAQREIERLVEEIKQA